LRGGREEGREGTAELGYHLRNMIEQESKALHCMNARGTDRAKEERQDLFHRVALDRSTGYRIPKVLKLV